MTTRPIPDMTTFSADEHAQLCRALDLPTTRATAAQLIEAVARAKAKAFTEAYERVRTDMRREALIERGKASMQLSPALIKHFERMPPEVLEDYLRTAPPLVPTSHRPAVGPNGKPYSAGTKRFGDMTPTERAALKADDPAAYAALRDEHERGE